MHIDTVRATDDPTSVGPDTAILGFQNGVTAKDRLIKRFGAAHVVGVATTVASVPLTIGELPRGTSARTRAIVQVFKEARIKRGGE